VHYYSIYPLTRCELSTQKVKMAKNSSREFFDSATKMYSVLLSDCTTTTYILLLSLECQGRDCLLTIFGLRILFGTFAERHHCFISTLLDYITVLKKLTAHIEIPFAMYEYLLKGKFTTYGTSVFHQNRHQCLVSRNFSMHLQFRI
jgi:hypothetical protein